MLTVKWLNTVLHCSVKSKRLCDTLTSGGLHISSQARPANASFASPPLLLPAWARGPANFAGTAIWLVAWLRQFKIIPAWNLHQHTNPLHVCCKCTVNCYFYRVHIQQWKLMFFCSLPLCTMWLDEPWMMSHPRWNANIVNIKYHHFLATITKFDNHRQNWRLHYLLIKVLLHHA